MADRSILDRLEAFGFGEHEELDPGVLDVPTGVFQRDLKPRNWPVFVPALFGRAIVVEVKEGRKRHLLIVDGQHRVHEAKKAGHATVPCVLYKGMTMEDAAAMFDILNSDRRRLAAPDEFRAACVGGSSAARALDEALLGRGLDGTCRRDDYKHLSVIAAVRSLQDTVSLEYATYVLDTIRAIWPWDGEDAVAKSPHTRLVRGFGHFLRPYKARLRRGGAVPPISDIWRWDREDTELLTEFMHKRYSGDYGLHQFVALGQQLATGATGDNSVGWQWVLEDAYKAACKEAGRPRPRGERVTRKLKAVDQAKAA